MYELILAHQTIDAWWDRGYLLVIDNLLKNFMRGSVAVVLICVVKTTPSAEVEGD